MIASPPQLRQARSAARLAAVQALYQHADGRHRRSPGCSTNSTSTGSARRSRTTQYAEAEVDFFDDLVSGALARRDEIDALIAGRLAEGWSLARLDRTMLQILRAGAYELLARADVPVGTAISEYLDVAHAFFDDARGEVRQRRARRGGEGVRGALTGEARLHRRPARLATHPGRARAGRRCRGARDRRRDAGPDP